MKQSTQRQDLGNNLITTQGNYLIVDIAAHRYAARRITRARDQPEPTDLRPVRNRIRCATSRRVSRRAESPKSDVNRRSGVFRSAPWSFGFR